MPSTIAAGLPPLRSLGAPVTFHSPQAAGIDLNINYEREIKPFIGRKLVSKLHSYQALHQAEASDHEQGL